MSHVCVHGLGYIGLPTAAILANYGHEVVGYDADPEIRSALADGEVHIEEPGLRAFVTEAFDSGNLELVDGARPAKYHVICVPTPLDEQTGRANLSYVEAAGDAISPHLRTGDTVILESTVPPRTTVDTLRPRLETSGLTGGTDFALVHCPETVLPGKIIAELRGNDRIIGGVNGVSAEAAVRLYESFVEGEIVTAPDATTAEFVKLIQNTYRDANIALANEVARLAADYGIGPRVAISLANRHPRVDIHAPGPGVGGHCLPIDPWFLGHGSDELDLIAHAREVNDQMPVFIADLLESELPDTSDITVAILGVAYKGNVGDTRNSPALALARTLEYRAAIDTEGGGSSTQILESTDGGTTIGDAEPTDDGTGFETVALAFHDSYVDGASSSLHDTLEGCDAAIITADHDEYRNLDPQWVAERVSTVILDTKNVLDPEEWTDVPVRLRSI